LRIVPRPGDTVNGYGFDPRRSTTLLIGGDKTGDNRFYERMIPIADVLTWPPEPNR
jgi:hypothetical protein